MRGQVDDGVVPGQGRAQGVGVEQAAPYSTRACPFQPVARAVRAHESGHVVPRLKQAVNGTAADGPG